MTTCHESAKYHVTGEAIYIDDIPVSGRLLHGFVYTSPHAHAVIKSFNLDEARNVKGVHAVLSYQDIPGHNQMGPVFHDEPVLAADKVECIGQAVFLIAAENEEEAIEAKKRIRIEFELLEPILTIEQAIEKNSLLQPLRKIECGDVENALQFAPHRIQGEHRTGAQEHWYLETQICLCIPGEGNDIKAYSSTQHPSETQALIAEALGISKNEVEVECRRMGGAFGGKETEANHIANWAALLCRATKKPVKLRLFRDEDQKITGKRHPFLYRFKAGFDDEGKILGVDVEHFANGGYATDLSMAILERSMLHAENAYYIPNMRIVGKAMKTNLPSNVAFRGFGGPEGISCYEEIIDQVARYLNKEAVEIRKINFYGLDENNITPYGETVEKNRLHIIYEQLMQSSEYHKRRTEVNEFNNKNEFFKRGLALVPVKFGISFTTSFLNQAGALVHVYTDGTILVSHGGTEMGQGLYTKMQRVAALEMGVSTDKVKINATNTARVANTSATAASSGSDLNGMAIKDAIDKIKTRLIPFASEELSKGKSLPTENSGIIIENNIVYDKSDTDRKINFKDLVSAAYLKQINLSANGFYRTPDIHFDRAAGKGRPFHYYSFGMAVSEVLLDVLTGNAKVMRTDILHDAGESILPNIDIGQVEGAFIQGLGWVTTEDIKWDSSGNVLNHSPDTYKIPGIQDIPADFRVNLLKLACPAGRDFPNPDTIRRSKAVGEPPFVLSLSVWFAIKDAISSIAGHKIEPDLHIPATNENILLSIEELKRKVSGNESVKEKS
ncbi:MAG: xanthine dehydrogenase molybdopterin binding subunit [Bacteroidia bacterium]|nr:xanthine dehydrogenase molybdopterin binding subunit [Bacteroidia bacterium]